MDSPSDHSPADCSSAGATCSCGATGVPGGRFCTRCGSRLQVTAQAPWAPPTGPHPDEAGVTAAQEHELVRALRDIEDGHLGLWGTPDDATADRVVSGRLASLDWVGIMLHRGWIAPNTLSAREILVITDEGRRVLDERWTGWRNSR